MDDDVHEKMEDEDLTEDEAEELQDIMDETGLDIDDAYEVWQAM